MLKVLFWDGIGGGNVADGGAGGCLYRLYRGGAKQAARHVEIGHAHIQRGRFARRCPRS